MKISREEKLMLIEKIRSGEMTIQQVANEYGVTNKCVYYFLAHPPVEENKVYKPNKNVVELTKRDDDIDISVYQNMTKDELIHELILSKANELRAKKGYEVRGDGANKEFIFLNNKNSK